MLRVESARDREWHCALLRVQGMGAAPSAPPPQAPPPRPRAAQVIERVRTEWPIGEGEWVDLCSTDRQALKELAIIYGDKFLFFAQLYQHTLFAHTERGACYIDLDVPLTGELHLKEVIRRVPAVNKMGEDLTLWPASFLGVEVSDPVQLARAFALMHDMGGFENKGIPTLVVEVPRTKTAKLLNEKHVALLANAEPRSVALQFRYKMVFKELVKADNTRWYKWVCCAALENEDLDLIAPLRLAEGALTGQVGKWIPWKMYALTAQIAVLIACASSTLQPSNAPPSKDG